MMISIIVNAWKEEKSIGKCINSMVNPEWNDYEGDFEIIVACPDKPTWVAAERTANEFSFGNISWLRDPGKGKPYALKLALKKAAGEYLILTDGDTYWGKNVISMMYTILSSKSKTVSGIGNKPVGGVTGRPVSLENRNTFMGYLSHLFVDAAHYKRKRVMHEKDQFYVLSGYLLGMKNLGIIPPEDCLVDDAYFSYALYSKGYLLAYEPQAKVYVKYAKNLKDWYKQKLRSVGGNVQLSEYDVYKTKQPTRRSIFEEMKFFWYPIAYAGSVKEFFWSLAIYPLRLWLWIRIYYERKIAKKDFSKTWVRIESTK